ncbi:SMC-Scp complex subunit ScpB [Pleionea litopenaei]|uniref:SMC-Scp complex subunit ScpB n=1 Tax=Pleionea litopenaei TaxID=3070815 RepID=A0AA51X6E2_9GAMM|nr:SMC-Scp complex subunit ScpB [Pleionea sp. HL-JVS1]WMS87202.1 SMC-Scp complex subunit ScpB [Pleionea sp. HL-JVS1]
MSSMTTEKLQNLLEAALMVYGKPMSVDKMMSLFEEDKRPSTAEVREALSAINDACETRGVELKEVASGFRFQAKQDYAEWIARLWEEKAPRYSRALLETLALIAYRQPITRSEIEDVRGVSVSSHIVKTLLEREWIRVVGYRDVPGRPALYATTREFLDYFNLKSLEELPTLAEIRDLDKINAELDLEDKQSLGDSDNVSTTEGENEESHLENDRAESLASDLEGSGEQSEDVVSSEDGHVDDGYADDDSPNEDSHEGQSHEEHIHEDHSHADEAVEASSFDEKVSEQGSKDISESSLESDSESELDWQRAVADEQITDEEIIEAAQLAKTSDEAEEVFNDAFEPAEDEPLEDESLEDELSATKTQDGDER